MKISERKILQLYGEHIFRNRVAFVNSEMGIAPAEVTARYYHPVKHMMLIAAVIMLVLALTFGAVYGIAVKLFGLTIIPKADHDEIVDKRPGVEKKAPRYLKLTYIPKSFKRTEKDTSITNSISLTYEKGNKYFVISESLTTEFVLNVYEEDAVKSKPVIDGVQTIKYKYTTGSHDIVYLFEKNDVFVLYQGNVSEKESIRIIAGLK